MASTVEMFVGTTALIVNTFVIMILFFIGNILLGPILKWYGNTTMSAQMSALHPWDITYIFPAIFMLLIGYEIVCIIAFFVITGRQADVGDYE